MFWTDIQGFLNTGPGVIKEAKQRMIALAQQSRFVGLRQNGRNLFLLQITDRAFGLLLGGDVGPLRKRLPRRARDQATNRKKLFSAASRQLRVAIEAPPVSTC